VRSAVRPGGGWSSLTPPSTSTPHPGYIGGIRPAFVRMEDSTRTRPSGWHRRAPGWEAHHSGGAAADHQSHRANLDPTRVGLYEELCHRHRRLRVAIAHRSKRLTWYTGSAGWMYRIWIEDLFGFHLRGNQLLTTGNPVDWPSCEMSFVSHVPSNRNRASLRRQHVPHRVRWAAREQGIVSL
jgi:hypothetical protein